MTFLPGLILANVLTYTGLNLCAVIDVYYGPESEKDFDRVLKKYSEERLGNVSKAFFDIVLPGYHIGKYLKKREIQSTSNLKLGSQ